MKNLLLLLLLVAPSASWAQSPAAVSPSGVLGQRLVEAGVGVTQVRRDSTPGYSASFGVTLPVLRHLDLSLGYGYGHFNTSDGGFGVAETSQIWAAGATGYFQVGRVKPFLTGSLSTLWTRQTNSYYGSYYRDTRLRAAWKGTLGAEIPWGPVTITPYAGYTDNLSQSDSYYYYYYYGRSDALVYGTDVHYWINRSIGAFLTVSRFEPLYSQDFTWTYTLGARYRF